jgi:hypothetical protein
MKKLMQLAIGTAAMVLAAPYLYETPLNNWGVFLALFVGGMYATALVQHWLHWRMSSRAGSDGASDSGAVRRL